MNSRRLAEPYPAGNGTAIFAGDSRFRETVSQLPDGDDRLPREGIHFRNHPADQPFSDALIH